LNFLLHPIYVPTHRIDLSYNMCVIVPRFMWWWRWWRRWRGDGGGGCGKGGQREIFTET